MHKIQTDRFPMIYLNDIYRFRHYIVYQLHENAIHCNSHVNMAAKAIFDQCIIGLPNIENTCWFYAMVQAIAAMLIDESKL